MTRRTALACALSSFALASSAWAVEKPAAAPSRPSVVASVGGVTIDASELEAAGGARLFTIYTQEYQLRKQLLDDIITKRLLETEAKSRGINLDELTRIEVDGKAAPVTQAEAKAFYDENKGRFGQTPEADALQKIETGLRQQRIAARRARFRWMRPAMAVGSAVVGQPVGSVGWNSTLTVA